MKGCKHITWGEFVEIVKGMGVRDDDTISDLNIEFPMFVGEQPNFHVVRDKDGVKIEWVRTGDKR